MKTKLILFATILAMAISQNACTQTARKETGATITRTYDVSSFNTIQANSIGNIVFTQSPATSVVAEGSEKLIELLQVSTENNTLVISMKEKNVKGFNRKNSKLEIRISSPHIAALNNTGVGNITFNGKIETPELSIASQGVGNLTAMDLNCQRIVIESEGVGNISLGGKTDFLRISSQGVGNTKAEELMAKTAVVASEGVGNVRFYASDSITVNSDGIGNVVYYGNPQEKQISKNGIGRVKKGE